MSEKEQEEIANSFMDFLGSKTIKQPEPKKEEEEEIKDEDEEPKDPKVIERGPGFPPTDEEVRENEDKQDEDEEDIEEDEEKDSKTPAGQLASLRKGRDAARRELKEAQERISELEAKSITIPDEDKEEYGEKNLVDIIQENKDLKAQLSETGETSEELKARLRNLSIEADPDFNKKYTDPIQYAFDDLDALISEVDEKGNVVHADQMAKLKKRLINFSDKGPIQNAREAKAVLAKFAAEYEEEVGDEYVPPSPSEVSRSIAKLKSLHQDRAEAKTEWEKRREEAQAETLKRQQAKQAEIQETMKKERLASTSKLIEELDYSKYKVLGNKSEVTKGLKEAFNDLEGMISDPTSQPSWSDMVELRYKAKSFDAIIKKLENGISEDPDSRQKGSSRPKTKPKASDDVDWMEDELDRRVQQPTR